MKIRRLALPLAAATLLLAADVLVLIKAAQNRRGEPITAIEFTERELRLVRPQRESTALFLELAWEPARGRLKFEDGPGWFDRAKLEELGFDCGLPLTDASAAPYYRAMPMKEAFLVLEYNEAAWRDEGDERSSWSRLLSVDAGRDFSMLRKKYPDAGRFLIVPGLVRLHYEAKWDPNTRAYAPGAYLRGVIDQVLVGEISVPPSGRKVLEGLEQTTYEYFKSARPGNRLPRYSAVLYYGRNHEPWVGSFRLSAP